MWIPDNPTSVITFNYKTMKWHSIRLHEIEFYIQFEFLHTTYYAVSSFVRFLSGPYIFCKVIYAHVTCYKLRFLTIFFTIFLRYLLTANSIVYNGNQTFPLFKFFVKVNSVQEAFVKCFVVQILKFEILQITWKKWNKEHQTLSF